METERDERWMGRVERVGRHAAYLENVVDGKVEETAVREIKADCFEFVYANRETRTRREFTIFSSLGLGTNSLGFSLEIFSKVRDGRSVLEERVA